MFKSCRNYLKKYYLCQKSAKSGSARIWKCVLTTPSGGHLFNQGHNGFQNCGKLFINWEAARGRCSLIFNVTAFSNVKLHILGKAIWLTIFFNHLWIDYSKYDIYHQYFAQKQVNCVFFKSTILIQARASQSYSQTALICTHFEQLGHFHMEAKSFPLWGGTMGNDVEIRKSSRVTMQSFCECGFVQTYCNNRSLHLNIYTFKHGLKTFFIQILWYLFT